MLKDKKLNKTRKLECLMRRLKRRRDFLDHLSRRYENLRLIIILSGTVAVISTYYIIGNWVGHLIVLVCVVLFLAVIIRHLALKDAQARTDMLIYFTELDQYRMGLTWNDLPEVALDEDYTRHPYAVDLDIVGKNALMRLMDTTQSKEGQQILANLLLKPILQREDILQRQRLVKSLIPRTVLHNKLCIEAENVNRDKTSTKLLLNSLEKCVFSRSGRYFLWPLLVLAAFNYGLILLAVENPGTVYWPYSLTAYVIIYLIANFKRRNTFSRIVAVQYELNRLERLLGMLEKRKEKNAPELQKLLAPLQDPAYRPSIIMGRIATIVNRLSIRNNPLVHILINLTIPWDLLYFSQFEKQRQLVLYHLPKWLEAVHRLEALDALGHFARLHPEYCFPSIVMDGNKTDPELDVVDIGHPLIPAKTRIVNDFQISKCGSIVILTGSNMSGKSAFLRTVGINVCLMQAGTVVCAKQLQSSMFRICCSIRIQDDLEQGLSFFYAEVKRLKSILSESCTDDDIPVLFLIDEIFRGTNNQERLIGSRQYLKALNKQNGLGLVSSHDLELAELATTNSKIFNCHFQESIDDGVMTFDYKLRPGKCPTTNALRIMKLEGLPINIETD